MDEVLKIIFEDLEQKGFYISRKKDLFVVTDPQNDNEEILRLNFFGKRVAGNRLLDSGKRYSEMIKVFHRFFETEVVYQDFRSETKEPRAYINFWLK